MLTLLPKQHFVECCLGVQNRSLSDILPQPIQNLARHIKEHQYDYGHSFLNEIDILCHSYSVQSLSTKITPSEFESLI